MSETKFPVRPLDDYPLSLRLSARALWGENFWGNENPGQYRAPPGSRADAHKHRG